MDLEEQTTDLVALGKNIQVLLSNEHKMCNSGGRHYFAIYKKKHIYIRKINKQNLYFLITNIVIALGLSAISVDGILILKIMLWYKYLFMSFSKFLHHSTIAV